MTEKKCSGFSKIEICKCVAKLHMNKCELRRIVENQISKANSANQSPDLSPIRKRSISPLGRKGERELLPTVRFGGAKKDFSYIADKNAQEMITEEECAKNKAEKKRAKKKRQRQKKLIDVLDLSDTPTQDISDNNLNNVYNEMENMSLNSADNEGEGFDINAVFVKKAVKKIKNGPILVVEEPKPKTKVNALGTVMNKFIHYESVDVQEALKYLSEAISLAPKRIDLVLKRSLIYYQLDRYEKSVQDAQKVVLSLPNNSEAYYRLGEGHFALNNLTDAECAFTKLINLNSYVAEANSRLLEIRVKQLEEMGYTKNDALKALLSSENKTIDEAIEHLTAAEHFEDSGNELYYSDSESEEAESADDEAESADEEEESADNDEESADSDEEPADSDEEPANVAEGATGSAPLTNTTSNLNIVLPKNSPLLTDPSNLFECSSLFVGNLKKGVTRQEIIDVFVKFGDIQSMNLTSEPNCYAFVNFVEIEPAGQAMAALQGSRWLLSTQKPLLIKFPYNMVNAIIPTLKNLELLLSKLKSIKKATPPHRFFRQSYIGPVNSKLPQSKYRPRTAAKTFIKNEAAIPYPVLTAVDPHPAPQTSQSNIWLTSGCGYQPSCPQT